MAGERRAMSTDEILPTVPAARNVPKLTKPAGVRSARSESTMTGLDPQEIGTHAHILAVTYKATIEYYRKAWGVEAAEADKKEREIAASVGGSYDDTLANGAPQE